MSSCMPRPAPPATSDRGRSGGLSRPPAQPTPPLASTPTPERIVATPPTDAPHDPEDPAAAVAAAPSTSLERFRRTPTTFEPRVTSPPPTPTLNLPSPPTPTHPSPPPTLHTPPP